MTPLANLPGQSVCGLNGKVPADYFFHVDTHGQCRGDRSAGWTEKFPPIIFSILTPLANLPGRSVCGLNGKVSADYFFHFDTPGQSTGAIGLRVGRKSFRRLFFPF
jgi:hypothetical protein